MSVAPVARKAHNDKVNIMLQEADLSDILFFSSTTQAC